MLQNQIYKSYSTFKKTHANIVPQFNLSLMYHVQSFMHTTLLFILHIKAQYNDLVKLLQGAASESKHYTRKTEAKTCN